MTQATLNKQQIATAAGEFTVFNYHAVTREYLSEAVEFVAVGVGLPLNACADAPPEAKKGFAICRMEKNDGWQYLPDHRGETLWDKTTGECWQMVMPGDYPVGTTPLAPTTPYDKWYGGRWLTDEALKKAAEVTAAQLTKEALMQVAGDTLTPLRDAVDLLLASADERARYDAWRRYRVMLMRVETAQAPDIVWPETPDK